MRRLDRHSFALTLCFALPLGACAGEDDPTPDDYLTVDRVDLAAAELPAAALLEAAAPLEADEANQPGAIALTADATLAADGDAEPLIAPVAGPSVAAVRPSREAIVAVRWGHFPPQPDATGVVDWSGFIAVSSGRIEVIRPLRLENGAQDDFVRPGADPRVLRIRSHTRPAWDGVLLRVQRPTLAPSVLVIRVGATTRVLPFEELGELHAREVVGDAGHELRLDARAVPHPHPCATPVATARGQWQPTGGGPEGGLFRGLIDEPMLAIFGATVDTRGPYGRFAGGIRDADGRVGGLRGFYAQFHYAGGGVLVGRARDTDHELRGAVVGRYLANEWQAVILQREPGCTPDPAPGL